MLKLHTNASESSQAWTRAASCCVWHDSRTVPWQVAFGQEGPAALLSLSAVPFQGCNERPRQQFLPAES